MSKIILRPFEPGDYGTFALFYRELHRLHAKAMPELFRPEAGLPPEDVFCEDLQKADRSMFLAEVDGKPAGMCVVMWKELPDDPLYPLLPRKTGHIDDLYVAPEFRRRGIASLLYREAERLGKERGVSHLTLMVWSFNEGAMELYKKLGFSPVLINMEKKLENNAGVNV
ncbi:GNAT family N-acetyltransferase [Neglectibacter caecimuris]|uniref:GNAT family N-acetyltransferase n=1 Tax=Neglectibacter caecimuris TaxID=3093658 RepID=UPI002AC9141A|nr:GNAT family N-acetyltransferase [Neglectibacter sp. M00184]